ncbi:hypothetical protein SAMN05446037_101672 [Anaerovirgula multivorans]|uniref:Uncharacterized protein n=1 Tax=Anaerovirgula multivorans TaxID=312168 RepID=A0A239GDV1_9FIRM|nr:hypothetical protein [Anaerovirgula multivorans]SNS67486.1 hypothetical protein SAMN05446037_101672 [Anaerovirgula multivorans]
MKKVIAGLNFLFCGTIIYITTLIIISANFNNITEWSNSLGAYWQTVVNLRLIFPYIISIVLLLSGIVFTIWGVFSKNDRS